jgi:hypothetical protein
VAPRRKRQILSEKWKPRYYQRVVVFLESSAWTLNVTQNPQKRDSKFFRFYPPDIPHFGQIKIWKSLEDGRNCLAFSMA